MKILARCICCIWVVQAHVVAADTARPTLDVTTKTFPAGHGTPEGAACDLARAFITRDAELFAATVIRSYGPPKYSDLVDRVVKNIREEALKARPSPGGPKAISKVFVARHLSRTGPASYGYAAFGFDDVMLVDVATILYSGETSMVRTMVIKDADGKWYVHPDPSVSPLLSMGLNGETPSEQEWSMPGEKR